MSSPFDPRDVEVLAAALPPQGANPVGHAARDALVRRAKHLTPGHYSQMIGTGPAFRTIFFGNVAQSPYEAWITPFTGLDDGFFTAVSVAMVCQRIGEATSRLRPQILVGRTREDLAGWSTRVRQNSYRFYAELAKNVDTPIRTALRAFPDEARRAEALRHYLAGITSAAWVNAKLVQDASGTWNDRDWELFHHWIKLTALGAGVAEIDAAIARVISLGLPVPGALGPGRWHTQAPWFPDDFHGGDAADATDPMLKTRCQPVPGSLYPACIPEDNSYEFTARSQPGNPYRQLPSSSCFAPGTKVVMADRTLRPIEDVAPGDRVATPAGPRTVILRPAPFRGHRVLEQFTGTGFAFAATHPFLVDPGSAPDSAAYAAADPEALARAVPTLGQFGIRPLSGPDRPVLVRHTPHGDAAFPAPPTHRVPERQPEYLYDLYIDVGADGRSEYYAGDDEVQVLVSSEVPRFAAAPETAMVVLRVLEQAGPAVLAALADVPDASFEDLLTVGLDSLARTLMPWVGPRLGALTAEAGASEAGSGDTVDPRMSAEVLAATVRGFAAALSSAPDGYDRRAGVLVEQFAARFAPQFQTVLALPWRSFDLAEADVANVLAVTVSGVEMFRPGPPAAGAEVELTLGRGGARDARRLPVRPGAPADRWYYSVDAPAYFPEWSPPGPAVGLWQIEAVVLPQVPSDRAPRMTLPLPKHIAHGFQAFCHPLTTAAGEVAGQAQLDVRLLTLEAYVAEVRAREAAGPGPSGVDPAGALAGLAAEYVAKQFPDAVSAFRFCAATTTTP